MTAIPTAAGGAVIRGAEAETLRFQTGSTMWLLAEGLGEATSLSAHRSMLRAGAQGAQPHHHEHTTHLLFMVTGSLELMLDEQFARLEAGDIAFTVDQQQYVQGYMPIILLYLYNTNLNTVGGGLPILTGPGFVDTDNVGEVQALVEAGTR